MDGKAERRWLGTSTCDSKRAIPLTTNTVRAYEGKSSELIPPGPRLRVGTVWFIASDSSVLFLLIRTRLIFIAPLGSTVAFTSSFFLPMIISYILGNYGHARSQDGRYPAAADPPLVFFSNSLWSSPVFTHHRQVSARLATTPPISSSNSQQPKRSSDSRLE